MADRLIRDPDSFSCSLIKLAEDHCRFQKGSSTLIDNAKPDKGLLILEWTDGADGGCTSLEPIHRNRQMGLMASLDCELFGSPWRMAEATEITSSFQGPAMIQVPNMSSASIPRFSIGMTTNSVVPVLAQGK